MFTPSSRQNLISTGNETLDRFLGGGLLNSSLNLFERQGPSSRVLDVVINKSIATSALIGRKILLYVNFNTSLTIDKDELLASLPSQRKVKSETLYKDIRANSDVHKIRIAWRYTNQGTSSPTDGGCRVDQVDFGVPLVKTAEKEGLGKIEVINVTEDMSLRDVLSSVRKTISDCKTPQSDIVVIIKDLLHPFSPLIDSKFSFLKIMYALRCLSRLLIRGAIVVSYDLDLCTGYSSIKQKLFNIADSAVSFYSYETGENLITGYKDIDGTLTHIKVPKINSFGFHFQQGLSDWGYRLTKNNRFFVVDELSMPPCDDDEGEKIRSKPLVPDSDKINRIQASNARSISFDDF